MPHLFISIVHAQSAAPFEARQAAYGLVAKINEVILFPLIGLLMAVAFLVLLWGAFEYVKNSDNESGRATGKQHLLWGTVGMFVMVSAYAILSIAAGTFGLDTELRNAANDTYAPESSPRPPLGRTTNPRPAYTDGPNSPTAPTIPTGDTLPSSDVSTGSLVERLEQSLSENAPDAEMARLTQTNLRYNCLEQDIKSVSECSLATQTAYDSGYISAQLREELLDQARRDAGSLSQLSAQNIDTIENIDTSTNRIELQFNTIDNPINCGADKGCIEEEFNRLCDEERSALGWSGSEAYMNDANEYVCQIYRY